MLRKGFVQMRVEKKGSASIISRMSICLLQSGTAGEGKEKFSIRAGRSAEVFQGIP